VPPNKILVRISREKASEILLVNKNTTKFKPYHRVFATGKGIDYITTDDYVSLKPEIKFEIFKIFGEEFIITDVYNIDYIASEFLAENYKNYENPEQDFAEIANKIQKDAASEIFTKDMKQLPNLIKGEWANKSKPN